MGAPIRSPVEPVRLAIGDALIRDGRQPVQPVGEERAVEVLDNVRHVDIGGVVQTNDGLLGANRADAHEVHDWFSRRGPSSLARQWK